MQQKRGQGFLWGLIMMGVLCATAVVANSAKAASGNGPYYATPSWDQTLPAATRFVILSNFNNEAVLDRNTGLVWEQSPSATVEPWGNARFTCLNKRVGNQKGWRLPAVAELASLVDPSVAIPGPTLSPDHPFTNVQSSIYWSASTFADNPTNAWFVNFGNGFVGTFSKITTFPVWCVRGGGNADPY